MNQNNPKPKIYISGQISGLPIAEAKNNFKEHEYLLTYKGYDVVNPFELPEHKDILSMNISEREQWTMHMKVDIKALMDCTEIYMMRGFQDSKGANIELKIAKLLNYKIHYE